MLDLNDLRVFERVAALRGFATAARALGMLKSSVSRSIARLEAELGIRLLQRTTREVALTPVGAAWMDVCADLIARVGDAVNLIGGLTGRPRGRLKIGSGIGFGIRILAEQLPEFLRRYPEIDVALDLKTEFSDLVAEGFDVAIRLGPMPDSGLVGVTIGAMQRWLCAAPAYLESRGTPAHVQDLPQHDIVEMPGTDGRPRIWTFRREGETSQVRIPARVSVNEALSVHRLVANGAGLGIVSAYLCAPDIAAGRLVRLLPDWSAPAVDISVVYPSRQALPPAVQAFIAFMRETNGPDVFWRQPSV